MNQKRAPFGGVPLRIDASFLLLGALLTLVLASQGPGIALLYVALGGLSLVVHELGHALAAKKLGYTVSVVLRAFRSATQVRERVRPEHEAPIALAGPAVTALVALPFWGVALLGHGTTLVTLSQRLLFFNLILLGISLLPALPQDMGHALYGLLTRQRGERAAIELVGRVGLTATAILALFAIWLRLPWLGLLSMILMTGTILSVRSEMAKNAVTGACVEAAMLREFLQLSPGDTLGAVAKQLVSAGQHDFPVVQGDEVLGILRGSFLIHGLSPRQQVAYVAGKMDRAVVWAEAEEPLSGVLQRVRAGEKLPILVRRNGKLVGMLTARSLQEFTTMKMMEEADVSPR